MFARSDPAGIWCALKFPWDLNLHPKHQQRWLPATGCPCLQVPKEFQGHWGPVDLTNCISLENTKASASWSEGPRSMCLSLDCHTHVHTHTCACKHTCMCVCTYMHTWYTCVHTYKIYNTHKHVPNMHIYTHMHNTYVHIIHTCPPTHTCTMYNTQTHMHKYTHTHMYRYACTHAQYTNVHTYMHCTQSMQAHILIHIYNTHVYTYMHMYMCAYMRAHTWMHHTHIDT